MSQISPAVLNYRSGTRAWTPPPTMVDHGRHTMAPDADFFQAPPADIGAVESAHTTLRFNKNPMSAGTRAAMMIVGALPGAAILYLGVINDSPPAMIAGLIIGGLGVLIAVFATRFKHTCSYVGPGGVTRFKIKGTRDGVPIEDGLRFNQAAELRTAQTRHYTNGIYTRTNYSYKWTDARGQKLYTLSGDFRSSKGTPKAGDPFYFARAAEIAWSIHLLDQADAQLRAVGYLHFNIGPGQWVRVGKGFFEFCLNSEIAKITNQEIKTVNLNQGKFHIVHRDAGWFSRKGKFAFNYAAMANAKLFLLAVDKLMGIRFG